MKKGYWYLKGSILHFSVITNIARYDYLQCTCIKPLLYTSNKSIPKLEFSVVILAMTSVMESVVLEIVVVPSFETVVLTGASRNVIKQSLELHIV